MSGIEELLLAPEGWFIFNLFRRKLAIGSEPDYEWEVRAESFIGDIASGIGYSPEDAIKDCQNSIDRGIITRNHWRRVNIAKTKLTGIDLNDLLEGLL